MTRIALVPLLLTGTLVTLAGCHSPLAPPPGESEGEGQAAEGEGEGQAGEGEGEGEGEGQPVATSVDVSGIIGNAPFVDLTAHPLSEVIVSALNVGPIVTSPPSAVDGTYALPGMPPGSAVLLDLRYQPGGVDEQVNIGGTLHPVPGGFSSRVVASTGTVGAQAIDLRAMRFAALAQRAVECGLYASLTEAVDSPDFVIYSAVHGHLRAVGGGGGGGGGGGNGEGLGVSGITKADLSVLLGANTNADPASICFLDQIAGSYLGTQSTTSLANGRFIIFKLTNAPTNGTGAGTATVGAPGFQPATIELQSSTLGFVTLQQQGAPPDPSVIDFETQVMPVFTTYGCVACHKDNGVGAIVRDGYPAIFTGPADTIYANLVAAGTTCAGTGVLRRVCVDTPLDALLITKPLLEFPANHPNASFQNASDPTVVLLRTWMEQGAPRSGAPPPPPQPDYSLDRVMLTLGGPPNGTGCTACHAGDRTPAPEANMALDGCIPNYPYPAQFAPANPAAAVAAQTVAERRRCVFYQLTVETSAGGIGPRIDQVNIDLSLLLTNPTSGDAEPHPLKPFAGPTDARRLIVRDWIDPLKGNALEVPPPPP